MTFSSVKHGKPSLNWWNVLPPTRVVLSAVTYIGVNLQLYDPGRIFGARIYLDGGDNAQRWVLLWNTSSGLILAARAFHPGYRAANVWLNTWFRPAVRVPGNSDIYAVAAITSGAYYRQVNALSAGVVTRNHITFGHSWQSTAIDPIVAALTYNVNANGLDLLFQPD